MGCAPMRNNMYIKKNYDERSKIIKYKENNKVYVMKQYKKNRVVLMRSLFSIMNELVFYKNTNTKSNFIVNLKFAFQDFESFYLVTEHEEGGDLRYHLSKRQFTEDRSRFIIACIILGLEFLHKHGLIYRNLKPENLMFDKEGYIKLSDFKNLRDATQTNYMDTSGPTGYIAPEIIFHHNHGCSSDIFSLGVVAYELMMGKLPYRSETRKAYIEHIKEELVQVKNMDLPEGWSYISADFINRCIQRRPINRIGFDGMEEVKEHKWFEDLDWHSLNERKIIPPFIPKGKNNFKTRPKEQLVIESNLKPYIEFLEIKKKFEGYYYDGKNYKASHHALEEEVDAISKVMEKEMDLHEYNSANQDPDHDHY